MNISKESWIKIASEEAQHLGFKTEEMIALNPDEIAEWQNYYKKVYSKEDILPKAYATEWRKRMESIPTLAEKLKGKNYGAIYFGPRKPARGGDLWIFIDKDNSTVIAHLRGK